MRIVNDDEETNDLYDKISKLADGRLIVLNVTLTEHAIDRGYYKIENRDDSKIGIVADCHVTSQGVDDE